MSVPLPITLNTTRHLQTLADDGKLKLKAGPMFVFNILAMNTNPKTMEVWIAQETIARRTGMSITAVKASLAQLGPYIEFVRHKANGIKVYRLRLPGLEPLPEAQAAVPEPSEAPAEAPFDPLKYIGALTTPINGISADRVRAVVEYHLRDSLDDYWRKPGIKSIQHLLRVLPTMVEQYKARNSARPQARAAATPVRAVPVGEVQYYVPRLPRRKVA